MYAVHISLKATPDIKSAYAWYQKEAPEVADEFLEELQSFVNKIADDPYRFPAVPKRNACFAILRRFPYKIYFQINEKAQRVEIVAVIHKARHPRIWKQRL